jgi:hypothetical protein
MEVCGDMDESISHLWSVPMVITPLGVDMGDEGTTPQVLTFGLSDAAQEQDGHSKPKKPKTN